MPERRGVGELGLHTLVLDLDETLVYSTLERPERCDHELSIAGQSCFVRRRPGVEAFVAALRELFVCRIWSTGQPIYVEAVAIELGIEWMELWGRDRCRRLATPPPGGADPYDKPLELINSDLATIAIVDNAPSVYACNPQNGIPITTWRGDPADRQLDLLLEYLRLLAPLPDLRREHADWPALVVLRRGLQGGR